MLQAVLNEPHHFVHTLCDPDAWSGIFSGDLGSWTPCALDLVVIGETACGTSDCAAKRLQKQRTACRRSLRRPMPLSHVLASASSTDSSTRHQ